MRLADYGLGNDLRKLAEAYDYIKEKRVIENGVTIIYRQIDIIPCLRVIELASKFQRLAGGEATQSINLTRQSLDQLIQQELVRLGSGERETSEIDFGEELIIE